MTDRNDGMQLMRPRAQLAAERREQRIHRSIIVCDACAALARNRRDERSPRRAVAGALVPSPDMNSPLNPTGKKHRFGKAWMSEHVSDPYVREANRLGYRSRAAFKLKELADRDHLFRPGICVVDLGAAPGSWSQVLRQQLGRASTIVAIDLLPMQGIAGVHGIQADFTTDEGVAAIENALEGRPVDLVVSDLSPNLSGIDVVDQARSVGLAELALDFARAHLRTGGDLVVKVFQGAGLDPVQRDARTDFSKVYLRKPKASRDRSREHYLVAKGLRARI